MASLDPPSVLARTAARIQVPRHVVRELTAWAAEASPREACGVLVGRRSSELVEVRSARRGRNLARSERSFELDPGDLVRFDLEARRRGEELLAIWHSHPAGPAELSARDRAARLGDWGQVIVSLVGAEELGLAWYRRGPTGWEPAGWSSSR